MVGFRFLTKLRPRITSSAEHLQVSRALSSRMTTTLVSVGFMRDKEQSYHRPCVTKQNSKFFDLLLTKVRVHHSDPDPRGTTLTP